MSDGVAQQSGGVGGARRQATAIDGLIDEAVKETGSLYPVPRYLSRDELKAIVRPLVENNK